MPNALQNIFIYRKVIQSILSYRNVLQKFFLFKEMYCKGFFFFFFFFFLLIWRYWEIFFFIEMFLKWFLCFKTYSQISLFIEKWTYFHFGDTEYFDIVAGVLQGDTLAPYLFIFCLDYVLRTSIDKIRENGFELTKRRSKRYPAKTITDADYADNLALLANTPNQAETLLERAAAGIGLHVNAHKTEYMCYNQAGNITTLDGASLKLVDKFTYLGSSVSSTEKDIDTRLMKVWTAIDRLSIIWEIRPNR